MRYFDCRSSQPLNFDRVIAAIAERFPGTSIVEADWYAHRYEIDRATAKRLGHPDPSPVVESLLRKWTEVGLQRGFEVPIAPGLKFYARLDRTGGYFIVREREFDEQDVSPLLEILKSFNLVLSYYDDQSKQLRQLPSNTPP